MRKVVLILMLFFSHSWAIGIYGTRPLNTTRLEVLGAKTLDWQYDTVDRTSVLVDHNYSKVFRQNQEQSNQNVIQDQIVERERYVEPFTTPPTSQNGIAQLPTFQEIFDSEKQLKSDYNNTLHRQPKKFYSLAKPIYIHGFEYPPDSESRFPPQKPHTKCPPSSTGQFVYAYSCSQFLNCWKGRGFVTNCAAGTLFNPRTLECDYAFKVKCQQSERFSQQEISSTGSNEVSCLPNVSGLFPHPYVCYKFLNCANGQTFVQECGPGTVFNPKLKVCDYPYNVDCTFESKYGENMIDVRMPPPEINSYEKISATCPVGESGIYPHPYECSKFLNCDRGNTFVQECGLGTVFNPKLKACDYPYNVDCANHGENIIDVRISPELKVECPEGASGLYPHPYECSKFLNCDKGRTFVQDCGIGTVFNYKSKVCDFPYNVDCEDTADVRVTRTSTSTLKSTYYNDKPTHNMTLDEMYDQIFGKPPISSTLDYRLQDQTSQEPLVDTNADYDFGASTIDQIKIPVLHSPNKSVCDSFNFYCRVDECIPKSMVCDGINDCRNGLDEQNCQRYFDQLELIPNSALTVREKEKFSNITALYCAKICLETPSLECRSFSYRRDDGTCYVSDSNVGLSGALMSSMPYDYYELKRDSINCTRLHTCPNRKCIQQTKICNGINDCGDRSDEKNCSAESFGYSVRLTGAGQDQHEGRIEVRVFGRWGYVCDDGFGLRNADVVCREVGFPLGALEVKGNSHYSKDLKRDQVVYLMDDVKCLGNETSLRDCDFNGWGISNCEPQEVVGVVCKTPQDKCPVDQWKCTSVNECILLAFLCDGVADCEDGSDEEDDRCDSPTEYRLVGGRTKFEGRIEVKHLGVWGTVCDDDFNDDAAKVMCRSMGFFGSAVTKKEGKFGPGTGPIWLDQVFCQGNESNLEYCFHWNWGEHNCEHSEDVGVVCGSAAIAGPTPEVNIVERHNQNVMPPGPFGSRCGYRKNELLVEEDDVHFRVIKGTIARKGDYPWQASLRIKNKIRPTHWCGAVVISNKFVLTAAHCLVGFSKGAYFVVAGDYNTDDVEGTEQEAYIEEFYIHEQFRSGQKMNNDIAVVKLKSPGFIFTKDIQPICLPEAGGDHPKDLNCTISGFGSVESGISGYSHDLRAGWLTIQPDSICRMPQVYGSAITDGMICAGSLDEGVDACDGDSGGPLACLHDGLFTLYGITSWGQHCGHANKPGVYVKISHYRNWIDETIAKHT